MEILSNILISFLNLELKLTPFLCFQTGLGVKSPIFFIYVIKKSEY